MKACELAAELLTHPEAEVKISTIEGEIPLLSIYPSNNGKIMWVDVGRDWSEEELEEILGGGE